MKKSEKDMKTYKCFIASPGDTEEERKICRKVVNTLSEEGYLIEALGWEDVTSNVNGKRAQDQINMLILECDIFIGIMSLKYGSPTGKEKSGTVEEFKLAYRETQISGSRSPRILFYFKKHQVIPNTTLNLGDAQRISKFKESLNGLYREYMDGIELRDLLKKDLRSAIDDLKTNLLEEVCIIKSPYLIQRDTVFTELSEYLSKGHLAISAPSGIGKTTLVQQFLHKSEEIQKEYAIIRWISLDRELLIKQDSAAFRRAFISKFEPENLKESGSSFDWTERYVNCVKDHYYLCPRKGRRGLLIIDNLDYISDEDSQCLRNLLTEDHGWTIFIITRGLCLPNIETYSLPHLNKEECIDLFQNIYNNSYGLDFDHDAASILIEKLGYNTHIINIVAVDAVQASCGSFKEYCENSTYHIQAKGIDSFFDTALGTLTPREKELLTFMIALTSIPIPKTRLKELLNPYFGDEWGSLLYSLFQKQWVKVFKSKESVVFYQCHSLSEKYFKDTSKITSKVLNPIVKTMTKLVESSYLIHWTKVAQWLPYAKSLVDSVQSIEDYDIDMLMLIYSYLNTSRSAGILTREEELKYTHSLIDGLEKKMEISVSLCRLKATDKLTQEETEVIRCNADLLLLLSKLYNTLASIYAEAENPKERDLALSIREENFNLAQKFRQLSRKHERHYAEVLISLGRSHRVARNYSQSKEILQESILVLEELLKLEEGEECALSRMSLANSYDSLGFVYSNEDNLEESIKYREYALKIKKEVVGVQSISYTSTLNNCAAVYSSLADRQQGARQEELLQNALDAYNECRNIRETLLHEKNTTLVYTYNGLSMVYRQKKDYAKAEEFNRKCEDIAQSAIKFPTQRWGFIHRNKALIALDQCLWDDAEDNINLAIKCFKKCKYQIELKRSEKIKDDIIVSRENAKNN